MLKDKTKRRFIVVVALILVAVFLLCGCEKKYDPDPAVEQFLNNEQSGEKAFASIKTASYCTDETVKSKSGEIKGTSSMVVEFDVSDKTNYSLTITQDYTGSQIKDGITHSVAKLRKVETGYVYEVVTNVSEKKDDVEDKFADDLVHSLVYVNNSAYDEGGLYYGDIFMLNIYKYPAKYFYVEEETNLCIWDMKVHIVYEETGDVLLTRKTKINKDGLIVYNYEEFESVEQDYILINETTATYA